jgi:hypothetical protein
MSDPAKYSVRELARQYHLSIKRVDAVLRLKGQEQAWIKEGIPLQTGFRAGMERILGVRHYPYQDDSTQNAVEAAALDEEGRRAQQRYQHMYWESIPEGESQPTMPTVIQKLKGSDVSTEGSSDKPRPKSSPKLQTITVSRPGRPEMRFVDVGTRFLEAQGPEHRKRTAAALRRAQLKARKKIAKSTS